MFWVDDGKDEPWIERWGFGRRLAGCNHWCQPLDCNTALFCVLKTSSISPPTGWGCECHSFQWEPCPQHPKPTAVNLETSQKDNLDKLIRLNISSIFETSADHDFLENMPDFLTHSRKTVVFSCPWHLRITTPKRWELNGLPKRPGWRVWSVKPRVFGAIFFWDHVRCPTKNHKKTMNQRE